MTQGESHTRRRAFPWYDSDWLERYVAARKIVRRVAPIRLEAFVRAFDPLRTDPAFAPRLCRGVLGEERLEEVRALVRGLTFSSFELHEAERFGRVVVHDHPMLTALQAEMQPLVEELVGEEIEPHYNFLSLYSTMGRCEVHMDSPEAKWTLDLCLDQSGPWPIHFSNVVPWPENLDLAGRGDWEQTIRSDPALTFTPQVLLPGDAVLFSGSSQWHYRNSIVPQGAESPFCNLLFLHYIPRGTRALVDPRQWTGLFGIAELDDPSVVANWRNDGESASPETSPAQ